MGIQAFFSIARVAVRCLTTNEVTEMEPVVWVEPWDGLFVRTTWEPRER